MDLRLRDGNTGLVGEVRDQSQLFGLLDTIRALGLELVSAAPVRPSGPPLPPPSGATHSTEEVHT
jgi:hypothetical protein